MQPILHTCHQKEEEAWLALEKTKVLKSRFYVVMYNSLLINQKASSSSLIYKSNLLFTYV